MKTIHLLVFVAVATAPSGAQAQTGVMANPVNGAVGREWQQISGYIARAAEQLPESDYAFRPMPEVRSFAQLIGHLAGGQFLICAAALGEPSKTAEDEFEKKTSKAELTAAFRASTEYCARAYAQPDAAGSMPTKLFGADATRYAALLRNAVHDGEHYGNIVTYLRLRGMVPPSSQPATPAPPSR